MRNPPIQSGRQVQLTSVTSPTVGHRGRAQLTGAGMAIYARGPVTSQLHGWASGLVKGHYSAAALTAGQWVIWKVASLFLQS